MVKKPAALMIFQSLVQNATTGIDLNQYYSICNISQGAQVNSFSLIEGQHGYPKEVVYFMGGIIVLLTVLVGILAASLTMKSNKVNAVQNNGYYVAQRA